MNPLSAPEIRGNWATLVTPWHDDESLDLHRLAVEIDAMIAFGVDGIYSNVACLHPAAAQQWWNQMRHDLPAALELESRIRQFMDQHIVPFITEQKFCNAACDRLMAHIGGWADVGTSMRWPYRSIPTTESPRRREIASELLPDFSP